MPRPDRRSRRTTFRRRCAPAVRLSASVATAVATAVLVAGAPAHAQTFIGQNFTASSRPTDSTFIPPDTCGAAGIDHFVELINGRYSVYRKSDGARVQTSPLNTFWANAGAPHAGSFSFDPRVLYDPYVKRWYALSVDNPGGANSFLFAVSNSADPTAGWRGFRIDSDADNSHWADFPMMGYNAQAVVVTANMFPLTGGGTNKTFLVLPKDDLLLSTPTVAGATKFENVTSGTGFSVQPAVDMDNGSLPLPMLSSSSSSTLKRSSIGGTALAPLLVTAGGTISVSTNSGPPTADQPGPKANIDAGGDTRFRQNTVLNNGELWGVHTVNSGGRAGLRWYRINATTNALIESGVINDPSLAFIYGSIAVNDLGDVVIGMSGTDPSTFVSTYAVVGKTVGNTTTFGTPFQTQAGVSDYQRLDGSNRNRWGDYSATTNDPADPSIFWTTQEYVSATDQWSTQVTEIILPQPNEVRWKDPVSGDYTDGSAWLGGVVPGASDHVIFSRATAPPAGSYTVNLSVGASATVDRFSVRQGNMSFDLGGNTLIVANTSNATPGVSVGEFGGTPTMRLRGTGTMMCVNAVIAPNSISTGTAILQDNAVWNNSESLAVGGTSAVAGGAGSLILASGSPQLIVGNVLKVYSGGDVRYNAGSFSTAALAVQGGRVTVGAGGGKTLRTTQLSITDGGRIDLTDNRMIIDHPLGTNPIGAVRTLIATAYDGGTWTGPGLGTSLGNATTHGLGYADAGDLGIISFAGHDVDDSSVVIRYTRYGDANLDGVVNLQDFNRLAAQFGETNAFWHEGDFTYDGIVNLQDFNRLASNFGLSAAGTEVTPEDWAALGSVVPETMGLPLLLGVAASAAMGRRRRRAVASARVE